MDLALMRLLVGFRDFVIFRLLWSGLLVGCVYGLGLGGHSSVYLYGMRDDGTPRDPCSIPWTITGTLQLVWKIVRPGGQVWSRSLVFFMISCLARMLSLFDGQHDVTKYKQHGSGFPSDERREWQSA